MAVCDLHYEFHPLLSWWHHQRRSVLHSIQSGVDCSVCITQCALVPLPPVQHITALSITPLSTGYLGAMLGTIFMFLLQQLAQCLYVMACSSS